VEVAQADQAATVADKIRSDSDRNAAVLKGFVKKAESATLLAWAEQFCALGDAVKDQLSYYEGHLANPGESFSQQLERQLTEDFKECGKALVEEGAVQPKTDIARGSEEAVKALFETLQQLMQLHELCTEGNKQELRWKLKIEINQDGACTKYHDDLVDVRLAMTLLGDGTVIADNAEVDFDYYRSCDGIIPELGEIANAEAAQGLIRTWNERVCKRELDTAAGDVAIMKGGKLTKSPCVHRAPYSAGEGSRPIRLLVTLDHIPEDELQEFIDMDLEDDEDEEEEVDEPEDGSVDRGAKRLKRS